MSYEKLEYRIYDNGDTAYCNEDGKRHRPNGPAVEFASGTKYENYILNSLSAAG